MALGAKVALERLREDLLEFKGKSDGHIRSSPIDLSQAQQTTPKDYEFINWAQLRKFVPSNPPTDGFLDTPRAIPLAVAELMEAVDFGDATKIKQLVKKNPCLIHSRLRAEAT